MHKRNTAHFQHLYLIIWEVSFTVIGYKSCWITGHIYAKIYWATLWIRYTLWYQWSSAEKNALNKNYAIWNRPSRNLERCHLQQKRGYKIFPRFPFFVYTSSVVYIRLVFDGCHHNQDSLTPARYELSVKNWSIYIRNNYDAQCAKYEWYSMHLKDTLLKPNYHRRTNWFK